MRRASKRPLYAAVAAGVTLMLMGFAETGHAQPRSRSPVDERSGREQAEDHFDLTGYWVPIITEDWLARMVTPPIGYTGQFERLPYNEQGIAVGMAWDPEADVAAGLECKAFGAAHLMRMPTRLRIVWEGDDTLRIDADYGRQTRFLRFESSEAAMARDQGTWQGHSVASWEKQRQGRGFGPGPRGGPGTLKVVTDGMRAGYLTRHGFPYSDNALMTEYFVRHDDFGDQWFTVTTIVEDPDYLTEPYVTSTHFRREPDDRIWNPRPCEVVPPFR
jgi:hypothetical protein